MARERPQALLVDYGGVLTTSLFDSFQAFAHAEGIELDTISKAFRDDPEAQRLLKSFERGEIGLDVYEPAVAAAFGVADHTDIIARMFGGMHPETAMLDVVARVRRGGARTGLLSNSWGPDSYDRSRFDELFDVLVISGEEGVRKPESAIYELAVERLGVPASATVFVDDLEHNLVPAKQMGMTTIHHTDAATSVVAIAELFGVDRLS